MSNLVKKSKKKPIPVNVLHLSHCPPKITASPTSTLTTRSLAGAEGLVDAVVRDAARDLLGLVAGGGALVLDARLLDAGGARAGDGGDVAVVGVDADQGLAVVGLDVLDDDVALAHGLAVAAGAVQLAKVDDGEAVDGHGAQAVVLDDLVVGSGGAAVGRLAKIVPYGRRE